MGETGWAANPAGPDDLAYAMGEVLGLPAEAQAIPRQGWSATFESFCMPPGRSWAYERMLEGMNSCWIDLGVAGAEPVAAKMTPAQVFAKARKA